jgi:hypothetical protein
MATAYRVYEAADGCDPIFCGEFETLAEAQSVAESEPGGLSRSDWDTARTAGHCAGMTAPGGGVEDDEPVSWHGESGWHCVVAVTYDAD